MHEVMVKRELNSPYFMKGKKELLLEFSGFGEVLFTGGDSPTIFVCYFS